VEAETVTAVECFEIVTAESDVAVAAGTVVVAAVAVAAVAVAAVAVATVTAVVKVAE